MESVCTFNVGLRMRMYAIAAYIRMRKPTLNVQTDSIRAKVFV